MVSRTTTERIVRTALAAVLINGFAVAFLWDGHVRYPAKNARQFAKTLGLDEHSSLKVNPGLTAVEAGRVIGNIEKGAALETTTVLLGEPSLRRGDDAYYLGPGGHLRIHLERGRIESVEWRDGVHTDTDQALQRYLGYVLGLIGVGFIVRLINVARMRVALTDAGLKITGRPLIPWEAIAAVRPIDVRSGKCVEIASSAAQRRGPLRLDDYTVKDFNAVVEGICRRKGFSHPYAGKTPKETGAAPA